MGRAKGFMSYILKFYARADCACASCGITTLCFATLPTLALCFTILLALLVPILAPTLVAGLATVLCLCCSLHKPRMV